MSLFKGVLVGALLGAAPTFAVETIYPEHNARSSPVMMTLDGKVIAKGQEIETVSGDNVEVRTTYSYPDGRRIVEVTRMHQHPQLTQDAWNWEETTAKGDVLRRFTVDFNAGRATAMKQTKSGAKNWDEKVQIEPGKTFSGAGFVQAIEQLKPRLDQGETVQLKAVGMSPKPRLVKVTISHKGAEQISEGGKTYQADHYTLHPDLNFLVGLIANVPDFQFWYSQQTPPVLLRSHFTLVEPGDPMVRVDTYGAQPPSARGAPPTPRPEEEAPAGEQPSGQ